MRSYSEGEGFATLVNRATLVPGTLGLDGL